MHYNIELKYTNYPELYREITVKLWQLLNKYDLQYKTLIASFDYDIIDIVTYITHGKAIVSGGRQVITRFIIFHKIFLNELYNNKVDAVKIPTKDSGINSKGSNIIRGANKRGMGVHYWTTNDQETMKELIHLVQMVL